MKKLFITILLTIGAFAMAYAQHPDSTQVYLDMPLLTLPSQQQAFNTTGGFFQSYMNPGMENSLAYSTDLYTAGHWALNQAFPQNKDKRFQRLKRRLAIGVFDYLALQLPLGMGWVHEEYHRAVMTQYGVNSFNEVLLCQLGESTVSVSHIQDEELAMLCDQHHPDFVRLMSAGHEAAVDLSRTMQSNQFFYNQSLDNGILYWINAIENIAYIWMCATGNGDDTTTELNNNEPTIESRDFTGMDMNAWAHALCYPDLPYAARGIHPSGVGINRYIMYDDIPDIGKAYLKLHLGLDVLNFISPMMIGFKEFQLAQTERGAYYGNFAFRHYLTAFGGDSSLDLYLKTPDCNLYSTLHVYDNHERVFGGLEVGLVDYPILDDKLLLGGTVMSWIQPKEMSFFTRKSSFGGLVKGRASYRWRFMEPYAELGWKSKGWVAGNVNLDSGFFMKAGLRWRIGN